VPSPGPANALISRRSQSPLKAQRKQGFVDGQAMVHASVISRRCLELPDCRILAVGSIFLFSDPRGGATISIGEVSSPAIQSGDEMVAPRGPLGSAALSTADRRCSNRSDSEYHSARRVYGFRAFTPATSRSPIGGQDGSTNVSVQSTSLRTDTVMTAFMHGVAVPNALL
jgi:hypothetical protein